MSSENKQFNSGLILLDNLSPSFYIGGDLSPLVWESITNEEKRFWLNFIPAYEVQNNNGVDKMNCTAMATNNFIETFLKQQTGIEINISDRFVAKAAGNTKYGNYVHYPIEAIKKSGFALEEEYPEEYSIQPPSWVEYYKEIPKDTLTKALPILNIYDFDYEFLSPLLTSEDLYIKLHEAPLKTTVAYASSGNPEDILNPTGKYNHDVIVVDAVYGKYWVIYDSYAWQRGLPTLKRYAWNYKFGTVMRINIKLKNNNNNMIFKQNYPYLLVEGNEQKLGFFLDNQMIIDEDWSKIMVQSASRLKRYEPAIPVKLIDWNSVKHVNLKGELIS